VEIARDLLGFKNANSTEIEPKTPDPVIMILPEQYDVEDLGGTMRLGGYDIGIKEGTLAHKLYNAKGTRERHRHRYEFNPEYREAMEKCGVVFSGFCGNRVEIAELPDKRFFIASQFHPEYRSRPNRPVPLFMGLVEAMISRSKNKK